MRGTLPILLLLLCACSMNAAHGLLPGGARAIMTQNEATDWPQFGYDVMHSGYNPNETVLGTSNVATLKEKWSAHLDSGIVAQPLFERAVTIAGAPHDTLYVTSNYYLYAIDPYGSDGASTVTGIKKFWQTGLPSTTISCGTTTLHNGTWDTPYIDKASSRLYVADARPNFDAFDIRTGKELFGVNIDSYTNAGVDGAISYNPSVGRFYVPVALRCGNENSGAPMHGKLVAFSSSGSKLATFSTVPAAGYYGGGIWGMSGSSIDPATNDIFVATGNSWPSDPTYGQHLDYAEHIVSLTSSLARIASNYPSLPASDDDFGDSPALFTPSGCAPMLAASNKDGELLFYRRSAIANGPIARIAMANGFPGDFIDEPVFDPQTQLLYETSSTDSPSLPAYKHGLTAFKFSNCLPVLAWNAQEGTVAPTGSHPAADAYSSPVAANGVVYFSAGSTDIVYANNARTGAHLWSSPLMGGAVRVPPTVVNGRLYVADLNGDIYSFGL